MLTGNHHGHYTLSEQLVHDHCSGAILVPVRWNACKDGLEGRPCTLCSLGQQVEDNKEGACLELYYDII